MSFKVKPFKEVIAMTKEKLDETLAPIRARSARAKANLEISKLEEELIELETKIHEKCAKKDLDFNSISDDMDTYELKERRLAQIEKLVGDLFPEK